MPELMYRNNFVDATCSERDIVVTNSVQCMCVHAHIRRELSGP